MIQAVLDGGTIGDRAALHGALAGALDFPDWYGGNLDALFDCLTDLREDAELHILHPAALEGALGPYAGRFLRVLRAAEEENPRLTVQVEAE